MLCDSESEDESQYRRLISEELLCSSSSDSDIDVGPQNEFARVENYSKNVVAEMDDQQFQENFRVTTVTFNKILGKKYL